MNKLLVKFMATAALLFFCIFSYNSYSQPKLEYNKLAIDCINKWVVWESKSNTYPYGYIYLDIDAGLTLQLAGTLNYDSLTFISKNNNDQSIKVRLQANQNTIAEIPPDILKSLNIEPIPKWVHIYNADSASNKYKYRLAFTYNAWNRCQDAIDILESIYKNEPNLDGLITEMAFSYNCLNEFQKTIALLENNFPKYKNQAYFYKELIYAYQQLDLMDAAAKYYDKSLVECSDTSFQLETSFNFLSLYYNKNDKDKFLYWEKEVLKWTNNNPEIEDLVKKLKSKILK